MNRRAARTLLAVIVVSFATGCAGRGFPPNVLSADIRRTSYNIPHIVARDEASLGYGIGYAYAQDNVCLLADALITVSGERSRFLGSRAAALQPVSNVQSDLFYRLINDPQIVLDHWHRQPAHIQALLRGYAAGYNRFVAEADNTPLPAQCRNAPWARPITALDLIRLMRRYLTESGVGRMMQPILIARPGEMASNRQRSDTLNARLDAGDSGSNAFALGRDLTHTGRGMLLANPHFPWQGILRFYQLHLTIPGKLDVMGASLAGIPVVNIGFTKQLAWTHTLDTSSHFTLYQLELDAANPTRYYVDGRARDMQRKAVAIDVLQPDGSMIRRQHEYFFSHHGPVIIVPGRFEWTRQRAYAIRDPNLENSRAFAQWYEINRARDVTELAASLRMVGLPWMNTVAADSDGQVAYFNISVVPHLDARSQADCIVKSDAASARIGIFVLDGSRSACESSDPNAPQPGIFAATELPALLRTDYVQNSNDSAWLTNPEQPLVGFPDIVSRAGQPLGMRTRFGLSRVDAFRRLGPSDLESWVMSNDVHLAGLTMDAILSVCGDEAGSVAEGDRADVARACEQLRAWNRTADSSVGLGYALFAALMDVVLQRQEPWAIPFDPSDPIHSPRGLNIDTPEARARLRVALADAARSVSHQYGADPLTWGAIQGVARDGRRIPIHGGSGRFGIYNSIESAPRPRGAREVMSGTSYLQVVSLEADGPQAKAILTYSQSSDPSSPHAFDQTERFS